MQILLETLINDLREQNAVPLAVHVSGTVTYAVYGAKTLNNITGYPVLRITEPSDYQVYLDKGFLLEADRVAGANGSAAAVDLKVNTVNSVLLLTNPTLIYG